MGNLTIGWLVAGLLVGAVLMVAGLVYGRFRRDMRAAQERAQSGGSQVIETGCGPIEYTKFGEGTPVLVVHGIFGGFDQGLVIARGNVGKEFRSILPSRFGYLRTPLPEGASPAGQADAFACLPDALGIQQAAVLGTSAGGTSAIQFALRHSDRCSALVLFSSAAPGETEAALPPEPLEEINVPVLIVNAIDDPLTPYVNAQSMAQRIPGAKLVTIESGGHMLLGHEERIRSEIVAFLEEHSTKGP